MSDTATGVIHDIGYQRYDGPRLGRGAVLGALYVHGLRTAFGLGRTAKAKIFPWFVVGVVGVTAVVLGVVRAQFGAEVDEATGGYIGFADTMSWLVIFFVAVVGPELVSRDLRSGVLPLYFSRPLRSGDYPVAKLAALASAVWLLLGAPQLLMFAIAAVSADGPGAVWTEVGNVAPGLLYAAIWAVVFAAIGLLVASLTGRRAFAAGGIVAVFLMSAPVVAVLAVLPSATANKLAGLASPVSLVQGVRMWLFDPAQNEGGLDIGDFGPLYGAVAIALVTVCVALLIARYRKVARS
ncbi:MAG: ABC transporter permease [Pseudonocardiaceae bacterium]